MDLISDSVAQASSLCRTDQRSVPPLIIPVATRTATLQVFFNPLFEIHHSILYFIFLFPFSFSVIRHPSIFYFPIFLLPSFVFLFFYPSFDICHSPFFRSRFILTTFFSYIYSIFNKSPNSPRRGKRRTQEFSGASSRPAFSGR